jgi:cytochrome c5
MRNKVALTLAGLALAGSVSVAQAQTAQEIVDKHCSACHQAGLGGAPKLDDKAAWAPRLEKGVDAMLATVKSGKGAMPPKGTCMSCSDDELRSAVELLTSGVR